MAIKIKNVTLQDESTVSVIELGLEDVPAIRAQGMKMEATQAEAVDGAATTTE